MKILVIEDSPAMAAVISVYLESWGYEVETVESGPEGWARIAAGDVSMTLCDWDLPGMDGPTLCSRVREAQLPHYVYFVLVTGRSTPGDLVAGLSAGADDFLSKPVNPDELKQRIAAGVRVIALEEKLAAHNTALRKALDHIDRDLEAASRLQQSILPPPEAKIGHIHFMSFLEPTHYVAGDIYNYFSLTADITAFYVIDVAGHGVSAALQSVAIHRWLTPDRLLDDAGTPRDPAAVAVDLNHRFQGDDDTPYFTMIYGILDGRHDEIRLVVAGHPPPLLLDSRGECSTVGDGGFPIGLLPDAQWQSMEVPLRHNHDRLVLFSDGIGDSADDLAAIGTIAATAATRDQLRAAVLGRRGPDAESDDISLMVIRNDKEDEPCPLPP